MVGVITFGAFYASMPFWAHHGLAAHQRRACSAPLSAGCMCSRAACSASLRGGDPAHGRRHHGSALLLVVPPLTQLRPETGATRSPNISRRTRGRGSRCRTRPRSGGGWLPGDHHLVGRAATVRRLAHAHPRRVAGSGDERAVGLGANRPFAVSVPALCPCAPVGIRASGRGRASAAASG
jgi:hypothetical protein